MNPFCFHSSLHPEMVHVTARLPLCPGSHLPRAHRYRCRHRSRTPVLQAPRPPQREKPCKSPASASPSTCAPYCAPCCPSPKARTWRQAAAVAVSSPRNALVRPHPCWAALRSVWLCAPPKCRLSSLPRPRRRPPFVKLPLQAQEEARNLVRLASARTRSTSLSMLV